MKIPRGFPRTDNVATIGRAVQATQSQLQAVRRQSAEDVEQARGIQRLGATLTQTASEIQGMNIRLDEKAERELEELEREKRSSIQSQTIAAQNLTMNERMIQADREDRAFDDEDWAAVQAAGQAAVGDENADFLRQDQEFADAMQERAVQNRIAVMDRNYKLERRQNAEDEYLAITDTMRTATTEADVAAVLAMPMETQSADTIAKVREWAVDKTTDIQTANYMEPIEEIATSDADPDEKALLIEQQLESYSSRANISQPVKDQLARQGRATVNTIKAAAENERLYGAAEQTRSDQDRVRQLDRGIDAGVVVEDDIRELGDQGVLSPPEERAAMNRWRAREVERSKTEASVARINGLLTTGYVRTGTEAQDDNDRAWALAAEGDYNNWEDLDVDGKVSTLYSSQSGTIPTPVKNDLAAAMQTTNPVQAQKMVEVFSILESTPAMAKTLRAQVSPDVQAYWDAVQVHTTAGKMTTVEARAKVDENRRLMGARQATVDQEFDRELQRNPAIDSLRKRFGDGDLMAGSEVQALLDDYTRQVYYENGGDFMAARKTAAGLVENVVGESFVNGAPMLMTPSPESKYGLSTGQIQDSIIRDVGDLVPEGAEVQLVSDNMSHLDAGWQVLYRQDDGIWRAVTRDNIPQRWMWTKSDVEAEVELKAERKQLLEEGEAAFQTMNTAQRRVADPGATGTARYYKEKLEEAVEEKQQTVRELYFRGS